ncbi:MAG: PorT family protein [Chitinophagaceae bacterium]|nr:PorT family protein [Chitinophagaceae bacterium]
MTKQILLLFAIILFHSEVLTAQLKDQFTKATIQFANGKTESVLVMNNETEKLNYSVSIKDSEDSKSVQKIPASEILSLDFANGKKFRQISFVPHASGETLVVLGKLLVTGKIMLYHVYYRNAELFVAEKNGQMYPLQNDQLIPGQPELVYYNFKNYLNKALEDASEPIRQKIFSIECEKDAVTKIIADYNMLYNNPPVEVIKSTKENKKFLIVGLSGGKSPSLDYDIFGYINYRLYILDFSRSTSINTGIHFYNYHYKTAGSYRFVNINQSTVSIPVFAQQNLLNKAVRPHLFAGFNVSYNHVKTDDQNYTLPKGFQRRFGFHILAGAGVDWNITPRFIVKAESRFENVFHGFLGGVAFIL